MMAVKGKKRMEKFNYNSEEEVIELIPLLLAVKKWLALILMVAVVLGCVGYGMAEITVSYSSSFTLMVTGSELPADALEASFSLKILKDYANTYAALIPEQTLLERAKAITAGADTWESLPEVSAKANTNTGIITVQVTSDRAENAKRFAQSLAELAPEYLCEKIDGISLQTISGPTNAEETLEDSRIKYALVGAFLGIFCTAGLVVLREIVLNKVQSRETLEQRFGIPVLGSVQNLDRRGGGKYKTSFAQLRLSEDSSLAKREGYHGLRTNLSRVLANEQGNCVGVSSCGDKSGRSTCVCNLAYSFTRIGKRVLLIDGDMREAAIAGKLGLENAPGLLQLLEGKAKAEDCVKDAGGGLFLLPAGGTCGDSADLLERESLGALLERCKADYDYVFVNLPPVTDVADAAIAARHMDGFLLAVRHNYSRYKQVAEMLRSFYLADAKILGMVLTDVRGKRR